MEHWQEQPQLSWPVWGHCRVSHAAPGPKSRREYHGRLLPEDSPVCCAIPQGQTSGVLPKLPQLLTAAAVMQVEGELEAVMGEEDTHRRLLHLLIHRSNSLRTELDAIHADLEAINRVIEQLAAAATALHDRLCRTLIERAGKAAAAERIAGTPRLSRFWFGGAGMRVDQALAAGAYIASDHCATQLWRVPEE